MSVLVVSLDNNILHVALPTLMRDLGASTAQLQWIVDGYVLIIAGLLLAAGSLADRFGRAKALFMGLAIFGAASAVAAWSPSANGLIAARVVMGIGAAVILPASLSVLGNVFTDPRERGRAIGAWSACAGLGLGIGPIVGGVLLDNFWWGAVFLVNVPIALGLVLFGRRIVPESKDPTIGKIDHVGVVLSIAWISVLVAAAIEGPTDGWTSPVVLGGMSIAAVLLVGFVLWELWCDHPMMDLSFFRNPRFTVAATVMGSASFILAGMLFVVTQLLQFVMGYSPSAAGLRLAPSALGFMLAALVSPRLDERFGAKLVVTGALGVVAVGLAILAITAGRPEYSLIFLGTTLVGWGIGCAHAPCTEAAIGSVPRYQAGLCSGMNASARQMGLAVGVAVCGSLLATGYSAEIEARTPGLGLTTEQRTVALESSGGALDVARRLGGHSGTVLEEAVRVGFSNGMRVTMLVGAAIAAGAALLALCYLPARGRDENVKEIVVRAPVSPAAS